MPLVPVVDQCGRIRNRVERDVAATMKGCRLVRDAKGRVVRVLVGHESPMVQELAAAGKPSNWGRQFVQHLRIGGGEFDQQRPVRLRWLHGVLGG